MKRQLLVTINAGEKTCGDCTHRHDHYDECGIFCVLFGGALSECNVSVTTKGHMGVMYSHKRHSRCLSAERRAKVEK